MRRVPWEHVSAIIVDDIVDACHVNVLSSPRGTSSSWLDALLDLISIGGMEHEGDCLLPERNDLPVLLDAAVLSSSWS